MIKKNYHWFFSWITNVILMFSVLVTSLFEYYKLFERDNMKKYIIKPQNREIE